MATVGSLFPVTGTATTASSTSSQSTSASTSASSTDSLANQNTFLQLLVTQLQYQDPTQPVDGTTFVTQLAQFSDLQANMGTETDLNAISQQYLGTVPSATLTSGTPTTTPTTTTGSTSTVSGG
jgi:flagellar basal-body rod modification protein FlgD